MSYQDRWRFAVEDINGNILTRDLIVQNAKIVRYLSGPATIEFDLSPNEPSVQMSDGSGPIQFKPWGHLIHCFKEDVLGNEMCWASGIFQPSQINPETGMMAVRAQGFSAYAKGIPWLENWNPIAVDPFEIVERIWNHVQSYDHSNLGVTVYPTSSGMQILPGMSFNNETLVLDFFAIFIRASDKVDCGEYINKWARDVPFEFVEESEWNVGRTGIIKKIRLGYPSAGTVQAALSFRINENIMQATMKDEPEISWVSDIIIDGFFPGKVYSSTLSNADPSRLRRVVNETDVSINSNERAQAWANRKLTRRQIPRYYESVIIDPYHPNAPFGTYDVGDTIHVAGIMPWKGEVSQPHRIMAIGWDEAKGVIQLNLMAEGAFNYDPIVYDGGP